MRLNIKMISRTLISETPNSHLGEHPWGSTLTLHGEHHSLGQRGKASSYKRATLRHSAPLPREAAWPQRGIWSQGTQNPPAASRITHLNKAESVQLKRKQRRVIKAALHLTLCYINYVIISVNVTLHPHLHLHSFLARASMPAPPDTWIINHNLR